MQGKTAVFYISGHGFGHASRMCEVLNAAVRLWAAGRERVRVVLRSAVPAWFFEDLLEGPFDLRPGSFDVGVVQSDSLKLDEEATLEKYASLVRGQDAAAGAEARLLSELGADLVVGDIPPFCFDAAGRAGVRSVALGNLSWDWIYEPYVKERPQYGFVLDRIRADYAKAGRLLKLPFSGPMASFRNVSEIPLIGRRGGVEKEDARSRLGLDPGRPVVLLSFGGIGLKPDFFKNLSPVRDCVYVCSEAQKFSAPGIRNIPRAQLRAAGLFYQDLVRTSDVVVTKPGYGILSECIVNGVPMLYTSRGNFCEYEVLVNGIGRFLPASRFVSNEDLEHGRLGQGLERVFDSSCRNPVCYPLPVTGAQVAAEMFAREIEESRSG